ncbi:FAD-dependent oxidoreductase [Brevibacterium samyangense]|uniref:N-methyl-L-tryptophan oxidase n=1 Tax=Brevibacterium samyangense TaxID=366888 RepID=A0ABP5ETB1_9MICO
MRQRVAVIGVGTIGSQVLWQLSKRDCEVTGYELFSPGHSKGAAGGETRLFRTLELEDLRYDPVVDRADELWKDLEATSGRELRQITGSLVMGDEDCPGMRTALEGVAQNGREYRVYSREDALKAFPQFALDDNDITVWDRDGGIIKPELTVNTAAALAEANGATILRATRVECVDQREDGTVLVTTDGETREFDRVVVASGAWTAKVLPDMIDVFHMRRLVSVWFFGKQPGCLDDFLPYLRTEPAYSYGLPVPDRSAVKIGLGFPNHLPIDCPDGAPLDVAEDDLRPFIDHAARYLPVLDSYPMRISTFFEGYTDDRHEYAQPHPRMDNVFVMAGFSGHGFKMSPAMGEVGADWATGTTPHVDTTFLHREHTPLVEVPEPSMA